MQSRATNPLVRVLYNHNPFYLISTCCVLYAIKRIFRPMEVPYIDPWMLMAALSGLTLLMAVTAWVVVRFGKVWEDARSLMLVLVIMFLAMSISFDEILNLRGASAFWLLAVGWLLSVSITEAIVRLLRIPLPWLFRLPFYLMLALFFGYPALVSPEVTGLGVLATRLRILAFPLVAGLCTLTLIPAVRRGPQFIDNRVTPCPWKWPLLPWTLFGFLGLAVCGRSYYLSISFDTASGHVTQMFTAFGPYALNPFLFAVALVLLEIGFVQRSKLFQNYVLVAAAAAMLICGMAAPTSDPTFLNFLSEMTSAAGSPLFLTCFAALLLAGYAWFRGVASGELIALAALTGLSVVGRATVSPQTLTTPHPLPLMIVVGLLLIAGVLKRDAFRCFLASSAVCAVVALVLWNHEMILFRRAVPAHIFLCSTVAIGTVFRGRVAAFLRVVGAVLVPIVTFVTTKAFYEFGVPETLCAAYLFTMTAAASGYAIAFRSMLFHAAAATNLILGGIWGGYAGLQILARTFGREVVAAVGVGFLCFAVAALISAHKARAIRDSGMRPG